MLALIMMGCEVVHGCVHRMDVGVGWVHTEQRPPFHKGGRCEILDLLGILLLYLGYDGLESLGVVDSEVSENLAVDLDACLVQQTHQLAVAEAFQTCGSIDTLNPQRAESALLVATIAESIGKTFLPSVLGNGPNILAGAKVTSGQTQYLLSLSA